MLIVGGGVAGLETLLALRELAEERFAIELLVDKPDFVYRPLAVAEPFGLGESRRFDLARIAADRGATLRKGNLESVDPASHQVLTRDGARVDYDVLVLAIGANAQPPFSGAVTIQGPGYTGRFSTVLRELEGRRVHRVAFAVPGDVPWPLPLYELALMTAARVKERGLRTVELSFVTPESQPLEIFGNEAAAAVQGLLGEGGIALHTDCHPVSVEEDGLAVVPRERGRVPAERVVTLPRLTGPDVPGLPHDRDGFLRVDLHGLVQGETDVYAAGDGTSFPIKQGGIATQQADAVAESIAARAGAPVTPEPFRPVLRGLLLTGESPRYLRSEIGGGHGDDWDVSEHALWWPPSKIAGRYLSPYLAVHHEDVERRAREGGALAVEVALEQDLGAAFADAPSSGTEGAVTE